ncbi:BTAD domain-containing putative transcriptional regulator [Janibacter cremeus]|uniref:BTAD domain-containing putative transcriptional regulator n=1 Tax=Janibacter cremeus TaxID=1285192 RepID=UPI0023F9EF0D|nr:BTAD domain-containing putative transcriptional regulator [Janibacter cremeus]WEV77636.1 BTAD domain-containing putative transcriptional regulator [Janibacter cremeus]
MPKVHIGVLGPLGVSVDGRTVAVPPGRRRRVLACLAVHRGRPVPVDSLIEAAWGEDLPHDPVAALHTVISRLRTVVGDAIAGAGPAGYVLDVPAEGVDAGEFEARLAGAEQAGPKGAAHLLEEALALWRGPAYAEVREAPFVMVEAMRLEGLRADATERLAALAVDAGDPVTAVGLTEALLAEEPFRERAIETLVTALYRDGRAADALAECRRYRARLADELGLDPAPTLRRLEQQVLGHDLPDAPPSRPPVWLDTSAAFIGREDELADLVAAVVRNRLTVVTGPGGVGKSRLAAEALPLLHDRLALPARVAELASVTPGGVALAVATSLGLRPDGVSGAAGAVVDRLEPRGGLLVIDNCEHVVDEVAVLARRLVTRCPDVRVLATSRRRLGVDHEQVVPLAPLAVPAADVRGSGLTASVRLLTHRVRRLAPTFALTPDNATEAEELCRRLDGLPLALELAAARVATRGLDEVLGSVEGFARDPVDGLEDVVAWSYRLLTPEQQALLSRLSVFVGDFTTEEVRGLVARLPGEHRDVGADLAELVESSLVSCHDRGRGIRYRLLMIVRAFATERLRDPDAVRVAHAGRVADVASGVARDWLHVDGAEIDGRLRAAAPEMVSAVRWALDAGRIDLAASIAADVASCMHWTPGVELSDLFIEAAERGAASPHPRLAAGVAAGAFFVVERGDLAGARRLAQAAVAMADGDEPALADLALAVAAMYGGDEVGTVHWFSRMARAPGLLVEASSSLALSACYHGDMVAARDHLEVALAAGACVADASSAFAHFAAGEIALAQDPARGAALLRQAAQEADRVGAEQVGRVARVALLAATTRHGAPEEAVHLASWLLADLAAKGAWPQLWTTLRLSAELLASRGRAAEAAFVLEATGVGQSAPPLVGEDVDRYAALTLDLGTRLGAPAVAGIRQLASATSRAHVVRRTEAVLREMTAPRSPSGAPPTMES